MRNILTQSLQDLRYALRQLRKSPGFTVLSTLTLAVGIGSATAVFSLVNSILLKPLPFPQPDRIVALDTLARPRGSDDPSIPATIPNDTSYPNFLDWRAQAKSFDSMASWQTMTYVLASDSGPARRVDGLRVSADFFRVFGVQPSLGRVLTRQDEEPGNRSIIIGDALWQSAFNRSRDAIGKTLTLSDQSFVVVGVLPPGFAFPDDESAEVWTSPAMALEGNEPQGKQRGWNSIGVVARLAPGTTVAHAHAELQQIQQGLARQYPEDDGVETGVSLVPELEKLVGDVNKPLRILFGAVSFLLLIACANVAGLMLTRTASRLPELAVRTALGATRWQIVRQLLFESLLLSILGGTLGLALAAAALKIAPRFLPADLPRLSSVALDSDVLAFAIFASLMTALLFGVLPAWRTSKLDPVTALRDNSRSSMSSPRRHRLHAALVIGETALGLVLLVGAGLLIRSFERLLQVDPGFNPRHVLTFDVALPRRRYKEEKLVQFAQQTQARLAAIPGVQRAAYGTLPLTGWAGEITFTIPGRPTTPGNEPAANFNLVGTNLMQTLQIPMLRGRYFDPSTDRPGSPPVVIVNRAFAEKFFPGEDPVGKHIASDISSGATPESRLVVGVIQNVRQNTVADAPDPAYYIPVEQVPLTVPSFAVRAPATRPPMSTASARQSPREMLRSPSTTFELTTSCWRVHPPSSVCRPSSSLPSPPSPFCSPPSASTASSATW